MMLLIVCLITLALIVAFAVVAVVIWLLVAKLSIAFSRVAMSLLISAGTFSNFLIFENKIYNFLLLAVIIYAIIRLISLLPRVDLAIIASCALTVGSIISFLSVSFVFSLFSISLDNPWMFAITTVISVIILAYVYYTEIQKIKLFPRKLTFLSNKLFVRMGRVIASLLYGFTLVIVLESILGSSTPHSTLIQLILLFVFSGIAYTADLFLFDRAG